MIKIFYKIATGKTPYILEKEVDKLIHIGYSPIGSIVAHPDGSGYYYYLQSMLKTVKE